MKISLQQAIQLLQDGNIVASPTCTIYGFIAPINKPSSIKKIFTIKKRPLNKPLLILIANTKQLDILTEDISPKIKDLLSTSWEENTTFIFKANQKVIDRQIIANGNSVAIRLSNHPMIQSIINHLGPIVAPSVNISGSPPLNSIKEIEAEFGSTFPILDDQFPRSNEPSTIISLTNNTPSVIRNKSSKALLDRFK